MKNLILAMIPLLLGTAAAQAQTAGPGGMGGNATINIYGGNIYLAPKGGDGGAGGGIKGGGGGGIVAPGIGAADPGKPSLWNHNGSTMRLEASGTKRRFYYQQPRQGIRAAGASEGTLLFEGTRRGIMYSGVAYVFAGECGRYPYEVSGQLFSEKEVVMSGMAPSVTRGTCTIDGYREDRLVFSYLGAQ